MTTITIQEVENTPELNCEYLAYSYVIDGIEYINMDRFMILQPGLQNINYSHLWVIPPERAVYWNHYTHSPKNGVLYLTEKTEDKQELGRRLFGEVGNVHINAKILRELALMHLRHSASTGHVIAEDQNTYIEAERLFQRADVVHTVHDCIPALLASKWLKEKDGYKALDQFDQPSREHFLDFFHEITALYHRAVFHTDEHSPLTWDEFAAQQYGEGRQFTSHNDLQNFYKAVQEACHNAEYSHEVIIGVDETTGENITRETRPADIVRNIVFAVEGKTSTSDTEPKYPSVAPTISVSVVDAGETLCDATVVTYNTTETSFQWYLNNSPIEGATGSLFDYAGHSGDLKVIATATDYIGGTVSAESSIIKIA